MNQLLEWLSSHLSLLTLFGLLGQGLFMMRFVAQWAHSEKAKRSVVPEIFWYFSVGGGLVLLIYAILRNDPVFIIGQLTGLFIYIRNIIFIWRDRARRRKVTHDEVFDELASRARDLLDRRRAGSDVTHAERRAAAEALHILQGAKSDK
jgi:lipid-A-disaccharide synthase-like uncharacterized protein